MLPSIESKGKRTAIVKAELVENGNLVYGKIFRCGIERIHIPWHKQRRAVGRGQVVIAPL